MIIKELSKDPRKASRGMSDWKCIICQATLFVGSTNPCSMCVREGMFEE